MNSSIITRFAPSPTVYLHIGGARTALFNFLYARHVGGRFLLRIEDTDNKRSTEEAVQAILDGLQWLGIDWDEEPVSQRKRGDRHKELAQYLLDNGKAYYCYCTQEELAQMRASAKAKGKSRFYDGSWRDRDPAERPEGVSPVIRLKSSLEGKTIVKDVIQGDVSVLNDELDDMVLLRADGSATYMLAVVVDDHDMNISHVIRGDDHFTNTFRQQQIYNALGWEYPVFAHIPLMHGSDGTKLSKRHGALSLLEYQDMGILPEAMINYLLRQGWSHGNEEIISVERAIELFDIKNVGRSPAKFDSKKLSSLNGHYLQLAADDRLVSLIMPIIEANLAGKIDDNASERLKNGMPGLKERSKDIIELASNADFYALRRPISKNVNAIPVLDESNIELLSKIQQQLILIKDWSNASLKLALTKYAENEKIKLGEVARPLRAALTGKTVSPGIFEILEVLGKEESLGRINDVLN